MPAARARGTGQFMKRKPDEVETCMCMKFEAMSGFIGSVALKLTLFLVQ